VSILYSQCWEDPELLAGALAVGSSDDVLSIASAGDNSLALLLDNPRTITAIDFNPAQLHLMELKMAALQLPWEEYVAFLGARAHPDRLALYRTIRPSLSPGARRYWDGSRRAMSKGVMHCGRLEHYLGTFRRWLLPLIHRPALISELLSAATLDEQEIIYEDRWNRRRWQWLFRLFFSRAVMSRLGRRRAWFTHVNGPDVADTLLTRAHAGLTRVPTRDNYFLEYILTGGYRDLDIAPPYLRRIHHEDLRTRVDRVRLVCAGLQDFLEPARPGSYSCFNLSDVFEYMSPQQTRDTWDLLLQSARPASRLAYRTLFVPRTFPRSCRPIGPRAGSPPETRADRTFFYDRFLALETG